jgi:O-antigen ligase
MRHVVMVALEVALPYYVVSRSLPDLNRFRDSLMSFAIAGMLLAFIATFEFLRHWLVYSSLDNALGVDGQFSLYLLRGENLRAMASSGQPIVLGYIVGVTFGLFLYLQNSLPNRIYRFACVALLLAGAVASLSRGPWVGMVAAALVFLLSGKKVLFGLTKLALPILIAIPIVANTDFGAKVIDYLPFIGSVDEGNVGYRERLLAVSINIILDDPFFGSPSFIAEMEELRQGQGIIDLVNTFLVIALHRGLIGLGLFVAFFAVIMIGIYRLTRQPGQSEDLVLAGRALLATLAGILVTIFTVSPISFVPFVYWSIAGLGVAYIRLAEVSWKKNCQSAIGSGGNLSGIAPSPEPSGRPSGCATLPG